MKKLFGLFLLALAFLAPSAANAVTCFWVGSTATWDNTNTGGGGAGGIKWASASNGASPCAGAGTGGSPGAADIATFDGLSGGGTITVAATINGSNTLNQISAGAFTGTLDFSVNNPSITLTGALLLSGTGARTYLMGTGTFTMTNTSGTVFDLGTTTNLNGSSNLSTATYTLAATTSSNRAFSGGGRTYGPLVVSTNTNRGTISFSGNNTFASWSIAAGTSIGLPGSGTTTITTAPTLSGGSVSTPITLVSGLPANITTISVASGTFSCDYCAILGIVATGGATFSATNTYDLGRNTGWSITPPSVGGGGGGRIIGG